jgi:hypothetical protein
MKTIQFPKSEIQFFFKELLQEPEIMVLTKKSMRLELVFWSQSDFKP